MSWSEILTMLGIIASAGAAGALVASFFYTVWQIRKRRKP